MEAMFRKTLAAVFALFIATGLLFPWAGALAAPLKGYEAMQVVGSNKLTLSPGETKTVAFGFLNIGTTTWQRDAGAFVSVYTYVPKYRTSAFQDASWFKPVQPAKLTEASVKPGEVGHVTFALKAPATAGVYAEAFKMAAEDVAWIPGTDFTVNVTVATSSSAPMESRLPTENKSNTTNGTNVTVSPSSDGLSGLVLLRSAKKVTAKGGEKVSYTVGIKNTGTVAWTNRAVVDSGILAASSSIASYALATKTGDTVAPGALDLITFTFTAPTKKGTHTVKYLFAANDAVVPELEIDIPVEVTSDAPEIKDAPRKDSRDKSQDSRRRKESREKDGIVQDVTMEDPTIRVGVLIVDEETDNLVNISCESDWKLYDGDGGLLAEVEEGEVVEAFYKKSRYWYNRGKGLEKTNSYLRFVPDEKNAVCTVENFDRTRTRDAAYPDNQFRNILELRYNSAKDRTWLINELSVETYLKGLGETSNISHLEFQKTLVTVARTYALYHFERATKHDDEYFHMTAYADDQVYRGYGQEKRSPRIVQSVEDTRGVVVTYDGKTAITPYFSRSDGRTRDWGEVWYGEVPWLKGVPAPCDKGKTLWGHGVGLSASEALCQANNGKEWKDILHYFYTGVDLMKRWR